MPQAMWLMDAGLDSELLQIIDGAPLPPLGRGHIDSSTAERLGRWLGEHSRLADTCKAGLWLLAGDLERSHELSQLIQSADGSYWHGIMHRREGDFENAKYWFRRVGAHPVLVELAQAAQKLRAQDSAHQLPWKQLTAAEEVAFTLVDCCRKSRSHLVSELAWIEWQLLFRHCYSASG